MQPLINDAHPNIGSVMRNQSVLWAASMRSLVAKIKVLLSDVWELTSHVSPVPSQNARCNATAKDCTFEQNMHEARAPA
jgi:hypothetical protein